MQDSWQQKYFNELDVNTLYDILKLRVDVFVVEQSCFYSELDDLDRHPQTIHLYYYKGDKLAAYLRILPLNTPYIAYVAIGRVVVAKEMRNNSVGKSLLEQALLICDQKYPFINIKISAQVHLESFYGRHGFVKVSDAYLEDGIEHIAMVTTK